MMIYKRQAEMPGAFALPTRAHGCPTFGRSHGAWANGRLDSKARHVPTCAATKKARLPTKGKQAERCLVIGGV